MTGLGLANLLPFAVERAGALTGPSGVAVAVASTMGYGGMLLGPPAIDFMADWFSLPTALTSVAVLAAVAAGIGVVTRRVLDRRRRVGDAPSVVIATAPPPGRERSGRRCGPVHHPVVRTRGVRPPRGPPTRSRRGPRSRRAARPERLCRDAGEPPPRQRRSATGWNDGVADGATTRT